MEKTTFFAQKTSFLPKKRRFLLKKRSFFYFFGDFHRKTSFFFRLLGGIFIKNVVFFSNKIENISKSKKKKTFLKKNVVNRLSSQSYVDFHYFCAAGEIFFFTCGQKVKKKRRFFRQKRRFFQSVVFFRCK